MNFDQPLPWSQDTLEKLKLFFGQEHEMTIAWWWKPFHQTGFNALTFAARQKIPTDVLSRYLDELSVPAINGVALKALDPEPRIRATLEAARLNVETFSDPKTRLVSIAEFKNALGSQSHAWEPLIPAPEAESLSTWLTQQPLLLKRFQGMNPWDKLEVIECVVGVAKSLSVLHFQRIG